MNGAAKAETGEKVSAMNVVMVIDAMNGQGHVSRSTALREAMPPEWRVSVCGQDMPAAEPGISFVGADIVIVDDYRVDAALIAHWQDRCPVVVFDDGQFGDWPPSHLTVRAHGGETLGMIFETNREEDGLPWWSSRLIGHDYCPIRRVVRDAQVLIDGVVVTLGANEQARAMSLKIQIITGKGPDVIAHVNWGETPCVWPSRPHLVVCAGGQTALEAAHLGVPSVIVTVAGNQNANARGLQDAGLSRWFGTWAEATANPAALAECVREQLANEEWRKHVAVVGPRWIDGNGGQRIVAHIREHVVRK